MPKEKLIVGPNNQSKISTVHETHVVESPYLSVLRKKAYDEAGETAPFNGSTSAYTKLNPWVREKVDLILSRLVTENLEVIEANRHEHILIERREEIPNLALDQGLNNLMTSMLYANFNNYACVGTGTTPTYTDSGSITATSSGTTVTSSSAFFDSGMTGQLIQFDTGEQRYITFVDTTHVTIDSSLTIGSATLFTVYAVNQTGLGSEVKRTHTFLTGSGNTGSSDSGSTRTYKVTHDFSAEVSNQNYTELGWSNLSAAGNNLNARSLISGGTVSVLIGQQLRTIHSTALTPGPLVSTSGTYSITGWPVAPSTDTNGNYIIPQPFATETYSTLDTSGGTGGFAGLNEVGIQTTNVSLGTGSTLPLVNNSYIPGTAVAGDSSARLSYTTNSFFRDVETTFGLVTANRTDWRAIYSNSTFGGQGFCFVFGQVQAKDNSHVLKVRVRYSVGRVLTNP